MAAEARRAQVGLALAPLSPDMREQLNVPDGTKGAVVENVQPGSPAEAAGLQSGEVIVGVGNHAVTSPAEAAKAMRNALSGSEHALALRVIATASRCSSASPWAIKTKGNLLPILAARCGSYMGQRTETTRSPWSARGWPRR